MRSLTDQAVYFSLQALSTRIVSAQRLRLTVTVPASWSTLITRFSPTMVGLSGFRQQPLSVGLDSSKVAASKSARNGLLFRKTLLCCALRHPLSPKINK